MYDIFFSPMPFLLELFQWSGLGQFLLFAFFEIIINSVDDGIIVAIHRSKKKKLFELNEKDDSFVFVVSQVLSNDLLR